MISRGKSTKDQRRKKGVYRAAAAGLAEDYNCPVEKDKLSSYAL